MKSPRHACLQIEKLEGRDCPTIMVQAFDSSLYITGVPLAGPSITESFSVKEVSPNRFQVEDITATQTINYGTYPVLKTLYLNLNHYNTNINVDLNGNTFAGNVIMNLGLGDTDLTTVNPVSLMSSTPGGVLAGNLIVLNGSGSEVVAIGQIGQEPAAPMPVTVAGNVTWSGRQVAGSPLFFNFGNFLEVGPGSTVEGNITTNSVESVDIGELTPTLVTTVGGNVNINDAGSPTALNVNISGVVDGNVNAVGTDFVSPSGFPNSFTLEQTVANTGGVVEGDVNFNFGQAGGILTAASGTLIGGNAQFDSGGGGSLGGLYTLAGTINGSLALNMGAGPNSLDFASGAQVLGDARVTATNGDNDLTSTPFAGSVGGNLSFQFGNGDNNVTVVNQPGGNLNWTSGNGNSNLTLSPSNPGMAWLVNLLFGNGNNNLTLTGNGNTISGSVFGGTGQNVFTQNGWTVVSPFTLNF